MNYTLLLLVVVLCFSGCADIKTPTASYILTHPLGTESMVVAGTAKEEVLEKWGEPADIIDMGFDDVGISKEAWVYNAWFPKAPLDYRHFSRKKKIYFTGDYVTNYEDVEQGEDEK